MTFDEQRFGGIARLYGQEAVERLAASHVAVVGIGGVGSWAAEALARLDAGDREGALVLLLADQDSWWRGETADPTALRELVRRGTALTLREAMRLLSWGPVADYFAHRWSDPTFLSGLALVEAHWRGPATAFELACGIGHHLREWSRRGLRAAGADVVFAKLWVAPSEVEGRRPRRTKLRRQP